MWVSKAKWDALLKRVDELERQHRDENIYWFYDVAQEKQMEEWHKRYAGTDIYWAMPKQRRMTPREMFTHLLKHFGLRMDYKPDQCGYPVVTKDK